MPVPNVLLLTGSPPGSGGVGAIFLRDLCKYYPKEHLCCFALCGDNHDPLPQELSWLPITYKNPPRSRGIWRFGPSFARLNSPFVWQYSKIQISKLIKQAVQFGKQHNVDLVWAILDFDNPGTICMAKRIADRLNAKLVTLVWDPPEYYLPKVIDIDTFFYRKFLRKFEKTLKTAIRCGVASEGMKHEYEKEYGVKSYVLIHGINQSNWHSPTIETNNKQNFVIGFAGKLYAIREWECLLSAISKLDWCIDGRNIVVRVLGSSFEFKAKNKTNIEYLGYRSVKETIDLLSEADINYLPYWFDESYSKVVRLSFPNKLPTYLASGRPVLFHGPEDSSPAYFFKKYPVGLCCHSLDEASIIECLQKFATDREFYAMATLAGQVALRQEFDLRIFLSRFAELIGIEEIELSPLNN
jgi:glycosyltransferase involved in cell wall biosynthesis